MYQNPYTYYEVSFCSVEIMEKCWALRPSDRPTFQEIVDRFSRPSSSSSFIDLAYSDRFHSENQNQSGNCYSQAPITVSSQNALILEAEKLKDSQDTSLRPDPDNPRENTTGGSDTIICKMSCASKI